MYEETAWTLVFLLFIIIIIIIVNIINIVVVVVVNWSDFCSLTIMWNGIHGTKLSVSTHNYLAS